MMYDADEAKLTRLFPGDQYTGSNEAVVTRKDGTVYMPDKDLTLQYIYNLNYWYVHFGPYHVYSFWHTHICQKGSQSWFDIRRCHDVFGAPLRILGCLPPATLRIMDRSCGAHHRPQSLQYVINKNMVQAFRKRLAARANSLQFGLSQKKAPC